MRFLKNRKKRNNSTPNLADFCQKLAKKAKKSKNQKSPRPLFRNYFFTSLVQILGPGNNLVLSYFFFYDFSEIAFEIWLIKAIGGGPDMKFLVFLSIAYCLANFVYFHLLQSKFKNSDSLTHKKARRWGR